MLVMLRGKPLDTLGDMSLLPSPTQCLTHCRARFVDQSQTQGGLMMPKALSSCPAS